MIVYISGAVSGKPENNKEAFARAYHNIGRLRHYDKLRDIKIINPLHLAERLDRKFAAAGKKAEWADYMRVDIQALCTASAVFFLKDWTESDGATLERHIAKRLGIPCADSMDGLKNILEAL
jgi:hypothetical protein